MITKGMKIITSYGTGPYEITDVLRGCTCASFMDSLNMGSEAPPSKPHTHCTCKKVGDKKGKYFLNGYDEDTLVSVWGNDYIIPLESSETLLTVISLL